jgi:hypothetical protein
MNDQRETARSDAAMHMIMAACRWTAYAVLAAQLLFAHGCHGDDDHDLFGTLARMVRAIQ